MAKVKKRGSRGTEAFNGQKIERSIREAARRTSDFKDRADEVARQISDRITKRFGDKDSSSDEIRKNASNELRNSGFNAVATEYDREDFRRQRRTAGSKTAPDRRTGAASSKVSATVRK
ncbi:MAG: ATP cone domain-containing protein [archaeon]